MKGRTGHILLLMMTFLGGCLTLQEPARKTGTVPQLPVWPQAGDFPVPTPTLPLRVGFGGPYAPVAAWNDFWEAPSSPFVSLVDLAPGHLPGNSDRPLKETPPSRSWDTVTQAKAPVLPVPAPVQSPEKKFTSGSPAPKSETKTPPTVPAPAAPTVKTVPVPGSLTPAAVASLLPVDKTTGADFRWEDVNAVAGDAVTLHFDKANWLYLDPPSQQKILGFQSISREKDATTFQFRPLNPGQYALEFQRQDLVNQSTDRRKVRLTVVSPGTRTSTTGTPLDPQTSQVAPDDALETSRKLAGSGKTSEAVQKLLQNYRATDTRVNLELARLLDKDGQDDEAMTYLERNLTLPGPDTQGSLELGTRLAAAKDPLKRLPAYVKLWTTGTTPPPEDLYITVLESLRTQKANQAARDWAGRYGTWFPAPNLKDQYLYQFGQLQEEPGDGRDIKGAWKSYNELVQNYPLSPYWKAAGERAAYLNRHFLQVR